MISITTYFIVCPLVFLAGFVDAIGGGGGLISLPAYLLAGIPMHQAIATNKLSSVCGTTVATARFIRQKMVDWKYGIPCMLFALAGSSFGANLSLKADSAFLEKLLIFVLPVAAIIVLNKNLLTGENEEKKDFSFSNILLASVFSFLLGCYDGFYGPGTGTFAIILLTLFVKMDLVHANGLSKVINLSTNAAAMVVFLLSGQTLITLGLIAALCNMAGGFIGSGLVLKKGSRIVRPIILLVLVILFLKILYNTFFT